MNSKKLSQSLRRSTFHFELGEPDNIIDSCFSLFGCTLQQVTKTLSSPAILFPSHISLPHWYPPTLFLFKRSFLYVLPFAHIVPYSLPRRLSLKPTSRVFFS